MIPVDWEVKEVGEVASIETGNTPPTQDKSNYGTEYLFVSPADLNGSKMILSTKTMLSSKGFSNARKFPKNSTLFTCIGSTIGKTGLASTELTSNQQINAVLPTDEVDSDYMYYVLNHVAPSVKELAGNQAVPIVNKTQFGTTLIPLPPTQAEQRAIAEALSDTDALLSALDALIGKKEAFKRGMMEGLLSGEVRLEGFSGEWKKCTAGDIGNVASGRSLTVDHGSGFPIYGSTGQIGMASEADYAGEAILIARVGANAGNIYSVTGNYSVSDNTLIYRLDNGNSFDFLVHLFTSFNLNSLVYGSGQPLVTGTIIKRIELSLPPLPEQRVIATVLSDLDAELSALRARRAKLGLVKGGMMEVLLGGEVRLV